MWLLLLSQLIVASSLRHLQQDYVLNPCPLLLQLDQGPPSSELQTAVQLSLFLGMVNTSCPWLQTLKATMAIWPWLRLHWHELCKHEHACKQVQTQYIGCQQGKP